MRQVDARRYVLRILSVELREALNGNREWLDEHPDTKAVMSEFDARRVRKATRALMNRFQREAEREPINQGEATT